MGVDLQTITQLRNRTGAGIADCKHALEEAGGDIEKAIENLRKRGEVKAAKKADRTTKEGLVGVAKEGNKVATVVLACETDFVAKNEDFITAVSEYANKLLSTSPDEFRVWAEENVKGELVVKIGENIQLGEYGVVEGEVVGTYLHSNNKAAGIVALTGGDQELANDIAMHIVAMSPEYLGAVDVPNEVIEKEKDIYREQMKDIDKPEEIKEKIIEGKLKKFYSEVCLLNQEYIKEDGKKVSELLQEGIEIKEFKKFSV
jgi:elongation factor Ts